MVTDESGRRPTTTWREVGNRLAYAVVAAVVVNLMIYGIGRLADVDFLVPTGVDGEEFGRVEVGAVVGVSVLPLGLAAGLAYALGRWAPRARLVFTVIVGVVLVLSFTWLTDPDISAETRLSLAIMHPVVAAAALQWLRPLTESTESAAESKEGS